MYKTFLLFTFLFGSFVCYHADQTMAADQSMAQESAVAEAKDAYPEPPLDAKEEAEFLPEGKKCACEEGKSKDELDKQEENLEKAGENLAGTYIQQTAPDKAESTSFTQINM